MANSIRESATKSGSGRCIININPPLSEYSGQGGVALSRRMPIFYSALLLTGVNLLLRTVSTSFQVYLSGRIGPSGIGLLQLVLSVGSMAMVAGMAGVRTGTMYLTAEEMGRKRPQNVTWILSGCVLYSILFSMAVYLLLNSLAPFIATRWIGRPECVGAIRLYGAFVPVYCLCGVMTGYFTAANRIGTLAAVEVAEQLLSMAVTVGFLLLWADSDPVKACKAVILGSGAAACMTLAALVLLRLKERAPTGNRIPVARRLTQVAVPLALADDLKAGINTTENLMVPKRLGLYPGAGDPLSAFGTVCGMVFPVLMFPAAILFGLAELLIPELARCAAAESHRRIRYLTRRSLRLSMLYGCIVGGGMYLLSRPLCLQLYDSQEAGRWLQRFSVMIPMLYCDAITDAMTKGLGQQKACVRYNILTSAMDVAFLFVLLPRFGMMGYYFSFLVTHLLNFGLSLRRLIKTAGTVISPAIPILTLTATVLAVWMGSRFPGVLGLTAYLLSLGALLTLLRVVGREDLLWLKGLVHKK